MSEKPFVRDKTTELAVAIAHEIEIRGNDWGIGAAATMRALVGICCTASCSKGKPDLVAFIEMAELLNRMLKHELTIGMQMLTDELLKKPPPHNPVKD